MESRAYRRPSVSACTQIYRHMWTCILSVHSRLKRLQGNVNLLKVEDKEWPITSHLSIHLFFNSSFITCMKHRVWKQKKLLLTDPSGTESYQHLSDRLCLCVCHFETDYQPAIPSWWLSSSRLKKRKKYAYSKMTSVATLMTIHFAPQQQSIHTWQCSQRKRATNPQRPHFTHEMSSFSFLQWH